MENYKCLLCLGEPKEPKLCCQCSKLFCRTCIQTYYAHPEPRTESDTEYDADANANERRWRRWELRRCPHCREDQRLQDFLNGRVLEELARALKDEQKKSNSLENKLNGLVKPIGKYHINKAH